TLADRRELLQQFGSETGMPEHHVRVIEWMHQRQPFAPREVSSPLSCDDFAWASVGLGDDHSRSISLRSADLELGDVWRHDDGHRHAEQLAGSRQTLGEVA